MRIVIFDPCFNCKQTGEGRQKQEQGRPPGQASAAWMERLPRESQALFPKAFTIILEQRSAGRAWGGEHVRPCFSWPVPTRDGMRTELVSGRVPSLLVSFCIFV